MHAHGRKQSAKTAAGVRSPDSFQGVPSRYYNWIKPHPSDDPIYIETCCLRDHIISPRGNNLISRAGSKAQ